MAVALFFDAHIEYAIVEQLRLRNVSVLTAQEDRVDRFSDALLLEHATNLGRPLFTHDIRFHAMAQRWQATGRMFCGLIFAHPLHVPIVRAFEIWN